MAFRGDTLLERGLRPLSNRHEVSSRTSFVRDLRLSPKAKMILISGHLERSEGSPILGRVKRPLPN